MFKLEIFWRFVYLLTLKVNIISRLCNLFNHSRQVAYETELSGTPTAVFTEIQLIGQFLVLGIIILI